MHSSIKFLFIIFISTFMLPTWAEDDEVAPDAVYYKFPDPFTINFLAQSSEKARYLQIKVTLMAHDEDIIKSAEANVPMLEDSLRTLFSEQKYKAVTSVKGRKVLQKKSLKLVKSILKEETGKDNIEAVYFTSFILQ